MKKKARSYNSSLRKISQKQEIEIELRRNVKEELIIKHGEHCMTCKDRHRDWRGITLSHIIALSQGGKTDMENCILECFPCHEKYEKKAYLRDKENDEKS